MKKLKIKKPNLDFSLLAILLLGVGFLVYFIMSLAMGSEGFLSVFFKDGKDFFMDYFNQLRDVAQGKGVYTDRKVIYPPMANLIFLIFAKMVDKKYLSTSFSDRYSWTESPSAMISAVLFLIISIIFLIIVYKKYMNFGIIKNTIFTFLVVLNFPTLFAIERGNILLLSAITSAIYLFTYNSQSKVKREIGLISLAFAFSIKLYPAVLGIFLIFDKRWKDIGRCLIYAVLLLLIPSFFFGGPIAIWRMIQNILSRDEGLVIGKVEGIMFNIGLVLGALSVLWLSFKKVSKWKLYAITYATLSCLISVRGNYVWTFMIAPLIMLCLEEKKFNVFNVLYFIGIILPMAVFAPYKSTIQNIAKYSGYIFIIGTAFAEAVYTFVKFIKEKKIKQLAN